MMARIGPIIGGLIYDRTGSYANAWLLNLILLMAISVLILTLKPAKAKDTARQNPDLIIRKPASHDT